MNVTVVLFNTKNKTKEDLTLLCPKDAQIPRGFALSGGSRKFVVVFPNGEKKDTLILAIGEPLVENYYYHKDILQCVRNEFPQCGISGGGQVEFTLRNRGTAPAWEAKFSGSSGDFGVFDKIVFENEVAQAVADTLKMIVLFETQLETVKQPRR